MPFFLKTIHSFPGTEAAPEATEEEEAPTEGEAQAPWETVKVQRAVTDNLYLYKHAVHERTYAVIPWLFQMELQLLHPQKQREKHKVGENNKTTSVE